VAAAMSSSVLGSLKGMSKAIYQGGRVVTVADGSVVFALGNGPTRDRAEKMRPEVETALANHFGRPVPLRLIEESQASAFGGAATATEPTTTEVTEADHEHIDVTELTDASDVPGTAADKLAQAFPGAVVLEEG
jgi:hypothetical protein